MAVDRNFRYDRIAFISAPFSGSGRPFMLRSMQPLMRSSLVEMASSLPRYCRKLTKVPTRGRSSAWACGIVTMRQQPETAKGVIFVTLEDETGGVNIIVWRHIRERQRTALLRSRLLAVAGQWQAKDGSTHLIARRLVDVTPWLGELATRSRDFH
jgi:DNA polymerase III alpha subunit